MLFSTAKPQEADDGRVRDEEWRTLMSHARADRVKLARDLRAGMSTKALSALDRARKINLKLLTDNGLVSVEDWQAAVASGRTDSAMSEILVRFIRVQTMATDLWGPDRATIWLQRPNKALDGDTPLSLLDTGPGADAVETLLGQIAHGIPS